MKGEESGETSNNSKIEIAKKYKEKGNLLFLEGKYKKASVEYSKSLAYTKGLPGRKQISDPFGVLVEKALHQKQEKWSDESKNDVNELDMMLKTNLATCFIKLFDAEKGLKYANEALEINPQFWRAIQRKGEALIMKHDYEKAIQLLHEASELAPDNKAKDKINLLLKQAKMGIKTDLAKEKEAFTGIFEKKFKLKE